MALSSEVTQPCLPSACWWVTSAFPVTVMLQNCNLLYLSLGGWGRVGQEVNGEEILLTQQASSQSANYFAFKAIDFHIHWAFKNIITSRWLKSIDICTFRPDKSMELLRWLAMPPFFPVLPWPSHLPGSGVTYIVFSHSWLLFPQWSSLLCFNIFKLGCLITNDP